MIQDRKKRKKRIPFSSISFLLSFHSFIFDKEGRTPDCTFAPGPQNCSFITVMIVFILKLLFVSLILHSHLTKHQSFVEILSAATASICEVIAKLFTKWKVFNSRLILRVRNHCLRNIYFFCIFQCNMIQLYVWGVIFTKKIANSIMFTSNCIHKNKKTVVTPYLGEVGIGTMIPSRCLKLQIVPNIQYFLHYIHTYVKV